ncbi:hypothetical protein, partial [Salmonella enterica]|uniref:hypothetical protein n=1 Tax=Salmonella enterica TaxID=28901 RepID=UPI00352F4EC2
NGDARQYLHGKTHGYLIVILTTYSVILTASFIVFLTTSKIQNKYNSIQINKMKSWHTSCNKQNNFL